MSSGTHGLGLERRGRYTDTQVQVREPLKQKIQFTESNVCYISSELFNVQLYMKPILSSKVFYQSYSILLDSKIDTTRS